MQIPIEKIIITTDNPRQSFNEEKLRRLGKDIATTQYGLIHPISVRPKNDNGFYELIVGERRLRACALIGLNTIETTVKNIDDYTVMVMRLKENILREDLSYAEKGDSIYALWATGKYKTIKEIARSINIPYNTVKNWTLKSRKISNFVKEGIINNTLTELATQYFLKYPHSIQNKLANISIKYKLTSRQLIELTKKYDSDPKVDLDELAKKVLGINHVTIPESMLTDEQKKKLKESKERTIPPDEQRCIVIIGKGTRCKKKRLANKEYCSTHDPEKKERTDFVFIKKKIKKKKPPKPKPVKIDFNIKPKYKIIMTDNKHMSKLEEESIHLIVTSPPYFNAPHDYKGYFENYEEYLSLIRNVARESYRLLALGRIACINCDDMLIDNKKYPVTADITKIFIDTGFRYRDKIHWKKPEGYIRATHRSGVVIQHPYPMYYYPDNILETILIFQKNKFDYDTIDTKTRQGSIIDKGYINENKINLNLWEMTNVLPVNRIEREVAAFPEELPKRLIKLFSYVGETILDPFLGSGTTMRVAAQLKRNSIGYEKRRDLLSVIKDKIGITKENKQFFEIIIGE